MDHQRWLFNVDQHFLSLKALILFLVLLPAGYFIWKTFLKEDKVEEEDEETENVEGETSKTGTKARFILDGGM